MESDSVTSDTTKQINDTSSLAKLVSGSSKQTNSENTMLSDNNNNNVIKDLPDKKKSSKDKTPEDSEAVKIPALDKYNLRTKSIQNRIEAEKKRKNPRKEPKPKQRPPPLSKYRRKNANARERTRMQEINDAFEVLKQKVPSFPSNEKCKDATSKLTKITTLRLAVNYIRALRSILDHNDPVKRPHSPPLPASVHSSRPSSRANVLPTISEKAIELPKIPIITVTSQPSIINIAEKPLTNQPRPLSTSNTTTTTTLLPEVIMYPKSNCQQPQQPQTANVHQTSLPLLSSSTLPIAIPSDESKRQVYSKQFNNFEIDPIDELNSLDCDPISVDIDSLFLFQQYRSSSNIGSDGLSCSSPSTSTETESLGSLKSGCSGGWDFSVDEALDVTDTFDIILESDESMNDEPIL